MTKHFPTKSALRAGQALRLHLPAGTTIVATQGTVTVEGVPACLAGQMIRPGARIQEGEFHVVPDTGWITLSSKDGADLLCFQDKTKEPDVLAQLASWLRACLPRRAKI
jgi:hypothetical protein